MSLVTKLLAIIKQRGRDLKIMSVFKPSCGEYNQRVQVEWTMYKKRSLEAVSRINWRETLQQINLLVQANVTNELSNTVIVMYAIEIGVWWFKV